MSAVLVHRKSSDPLAAQVQAVEAFALQVRYPVDWPTPILSDEALAVLGEFYQQERLWERGVRFLCFCQAPHVFGFHRPIEHEVGGNVYRLLPRQRRVAACVARTWPIV